MGEEEGYERVGEEGVREDGDVVGWGVGGGEGCGVDV